MRDGVEDGDARDVEEKMDQSYLESRPLIALAGEGRQETGGGGADVAAQCERVDSLQADQASPGKGVRVEVNTELDWTRTVMTAPTNMAR